MSSRKKKRNTSGEVWIIVIIAILCLLACGLAVYLYWQTTDKKSDGRPVATEMSTGTDSTSVTATVTEITTEEITEAPDPEMEINEKISDRIAEMDIREKIGQMFFIRGNPDYDQTMFDTYNPGGVLLFGSDVQDKTYTELQDYIDNFQRMSGTPLLIGIDEEGGTVSRLSGNYNIVDQPFLSPRELYADGGMDEVIQDSHRKSTLLLDLGINVNFAPVVDYSTDLWDFMYERAFGDTIDETCEFAKEIVSAMNEDGMGSVLKHFPGYGSNGDTHTDIITDDRDYDTFASQDFLPFQSGIDAGAECVLVCHNIVTCMDSKWPASLSENVHNVLREKLGFIGVIITDDLAMDGVADFCGADTAAVQAILAGNDMMIVSDFYTQYDAVLQAVQDGTISEQRLDESVARILKWKYHLNILR